MELRSLVPVLVALLVGLLIFRMIVGVVRSSGKLLTWAVLAAAVFGLGYLWYQSLDPADRPSLPTLSIPAPLEPPAR